MTGITTRPLTDGDAPYFTAEEILQGWHSTEDKLRMRMEHCRAGMCVSVVGEIDGKAAGYIFVYPASKWGAFGGRGLPEIVDFAVLEKFRRHGVGSALMDEAERIAGEYADTVYLGVGLHAGFGAAQRMYVKRGYVPDGSGVWYRDRVCEPYSPCENDDDLVLYLSKKLR